jgi:hypothetical protein
MTFKVLNLGQMYGVCVCVCVRACVCFQVDRFERLKYPVHALKFCHRGCSIVPFLCGRSVLAEAYLTCTRLHELTSLSFSSYWFPITLRDDLLFSFLV